MADETDASVAPSSGRASRVVGGCRSVLRTSILTGAAVTLPFLVTVVILAIVASIVTDVISPFVTALSWAPVVDQDPWVLEIATVLGLLVAMVVVGYVAAYLTGPERLERPVDEFMTALPGVGTVYETCNKMSEFLVDGEGHSFQEVVLVEYPTEGSYVLAFETAEPPEAIEDAIGSDDMVTLFMPMAPNPVMGGFVLHVPPERVLPVDLSVEQGVQSIVTSGVATGQPIHEQPAALADGGDG